MTIRVLVVVSFLAGGCLFAAERDANDESETPSREPTLTERIEVRAARPREEDVAAFATTIDTGEVAERGEDLADLLRRVPGARVRDYGGLGSYATMSLRASTSEQVTVLVDGVPQNRALGGPVDLSSIPATQLENVTVFRGFGPAAYGLGGIGGVVDVRTRSPSSEPEFRVDALAGELATARLSGDLTLRAGESNGFRVGAEWLRSDGNFVYLDTGETLFTRADDELRQRTNNDVEQASLLLQYSRDRLGGGGLQAKLRLQDRERGVPGLGTLRSETARLDEGLQDFNLAWTRAYGGAIESVDLLADVFGQQIGFYDLDGTIGLRAQDQTTRLSGGGAAGLLRARLGAHRALLRLDMRHEEASVRDRALDDPDLGGAKRGLLALTAEDMITAGRVTLAPSLRWEKRRDDFVSGAGGSLAPPADDLEDAVWSGKLGLACRLGPETTLRASAGHFNRIPSLLELFGDRGSILGNPALRPEKGNAAEIGFARGELRSARTPWTGEIVAFGRRSEDLILLLPVSQGIAVARNVAEVETYGLEASVSLRPLRRWILRATGTLQRAVDVSRGFSEGRPLPYQPEILGYAGAGYRHRGLRAMWEITYTGENSTDSLDTPELRLPERIIHDASVGVDLGHGFSFGLDVRNVFDRRTLDLLRYPLPGRVVLFHLGWRNERESS